MSSGEIMAIGIISIIVIVTLGSFTMFIIRAHNEMTLKHTAINLYDEFMGEYFEYGVYIQSDTVKLEYYRELSNLYFSVEDIDECREFPNRLNKLKIDIHKKFGNHSPSMRRDDRLKKISSLIDV
jgi:thiaminase